MGNLAKRWINMKNDQNGFSLIELLTVVAVIGIMAMIAVPNFTSMKKQMIYNSEIRDIYSQLQRSKMEAVKSNSSQSYTLGSTSSGYAPARNITVTFSSLGILTSAVYADDGTPALDSEGKVTVAYPNTDGGRSLSIVINVAGGISIT